MNKYKQVVIVLVLVSFCIPGFAQIDVVFGEASADAQEHYQSQTQAE